MATYRSELKKYIGKWVPRVTATLSERSGGRNGYGYLLNNICFPDGTEVDHCWIGGGEGMGCTYWLDATTCLGKQIRFTAFVDQYVSEGSLRHGGDGVGIGITGIEKVKVQMDGTWLPITTAATKIRQKRRLELAEKKKDANYIWPGSWTYKGGGLRVKAAKSAIPGALCRVVSRDGQHDETVMLVALDEANGTWSWERAPERKAQIDEKWRQN